MFRPVMSVVAFAAISVIAISANAEKKENELEKLHGTWIVVEAEFDGSHEKCELKKGDKLLFDGKKYKFEAKHFPEEGTFAVDGSKKVKEINLLDTKDKKSLGIYEVNNEELKICFRVGERPGEFKSGKKALLVNLKRQKK